MHVSMMILSYTALLCGSLLSVALLVITFRKIFYSSKSNNLLKLNESFSFGEIQYKNERNNTFQKTSFFLIRIITMPNLFNNWIIGVIV
ncbi:putative cytochrome c assembly protein [Helianthus anomalus]